MKRRAGVLVAIPVALLLVFPRMCRGADADVLPRGVWTVNLDGIQYLPIEKRYNDDGKVESAAADYNAVLGSNVLGPDFDSLQPLVDLVNPGSGAANIGASVVDYKYVTTRITTTVGYGITDRLTVGVIVPYQWMRNDVSARLDTTGANVGGNPTYLGSTWQDFDAANPGVLPPGLAPLLDGSPFLPTGLNALIPGSVPLLTTEDVQGLIGPGLDVNGDGVPDTPSLGYKRLESWGDQGFADIDLGLKYQYYKSDNWRFAGSFGVRIPTGKVDDPDNLADWGFGNGAWALLFRSYNDYIGLKRFTFNVNFSYDLYLPDHQTLRVPDTRGGLTANKENVSRNLGDVVEVDTSARYNITEPFSVFLSYKYGHSFKDSVSGNMGFDYASLEDGTNYTEHVFYAGLGYTTIPMFVDKKFPVPINTSIYYRNRFAGQNYILKSEYIGLALQFFF